MQLIDVIGVLQQDIIEEMKRLALEQKDSEELEEVILMVMLLYRDYIRQAILDTYDDAVRRITEHILEQWGIEVDIEYDASQTAENINLFVFSALLSTGGQQSEAVSMYERIVAHAKQADDYKEAVMNLMMRLLDKGFMSAFVEKRKGKIVRWAIDRYMNQLEKHIYQDIYNDAQIKATKKAQVELVRVDAFPEPRNACTKLQASGVICIVPRSQASPESLQYPNIHDPEHRYMELGGHHGRDGNCRHAWHSLDGKLTMELYRAIDVASVKMHIFRERFKHIILKG